MRPTEAAADVVRETGHLGPAKLQQVCQEIALLQYLRTLMNHGDQLAQDSLKKNPAKMITLINACCNMAIAGIAIDRHNWRSQNAPGDSSQVPAALSSEAPATETNRLPANIATIPKLPKPPRMLSSKLKS